MLSVLAVAGAILPASNLADANTAHGKPGPGRAPGVTITLGRSTRRLPHSFFGFSTEYTELPLYERNIPLFERVLSLLRIPDTGPMVLRIGGQSADRTFWNPDKRPLHTPYAYVLTPKWFRLAATVARQLRLRLLLDLNLRTSSPSMSAGLARAAKARLPRGSIAGFEIGNEPDQYPGDYSVEDYVSDFQTYAQAVRRVAPKVRLLGPASASTNLQWMSGVVWGDRSVLSVLTGHRYPLSACVAPGSSLYPTIPRLLSESTSATMAQEVHPAVALAHQANVGFRLDELNSVTCGGVPGVSNTFATALWAPDALFELLSRGVPGLNVHMRPTRINGPFVIRRSGLEVRPLLYGLILFARAMGPGARLVHLNLHFSHEKAHLKAWAVRLAGGAMHVLLINKGSRQLTVDLRLPPDGVGTVDRLLAASAAATSGVTLGGQHLGADGTWHGSNTDESILPGPSGYQLAVPRFSAALLSLPAPVVPQASAPSG